MKLVADSLCVTRSERVIFSEIGFEVESGQALIVTGPNGAGKSTLLKTIAGYLKPERGTIELSDRGEARISECCHYLAHDNALKPSLTVRENLGFWQDFLGPGETIEEALDAVGLAGIEAIPAGYLSAGQKRRVAIARLLVSRRHVWLVDEPTAALDTASEHRFSEIAEAHLGTGGLLVAATHQKLGLANARTLDFGSHQGKAMA